MPTYLTIHDVIAIHERAMQADGSPPRPLVRAELLESGLYRPQQAAYYKEADIVRQAALLAVAISEARALEDGNKTTAFACLDVFLRANGRHISVSQHEIADALIAISVARAGRDDAIDALETLLRDNIEQIAE